MTFAHLRFQGVRVCHGRDRWQQAAGMVTRTGIRAYSLCHKHDAERELEVGKGCKLSEVALSDAPPPARLCLLHLPKQCHQMGTKCSDTLAYGDISHSNHHIRPERKYLCWLSHFTSPTQFFFPFSK